MFKKIKQYLSERRIIKIIKDNQVDAHILPLRPIDTLVMNIKSECTKADVANIKDIVQKATGSKVLVFTCCDGIDFYVLKNM